MDYDSSNPDMCVAPSVSLAGWLAERNVTPGELASRSGDGFGGIRAALLIRDVLTRQPLATAHARVLEQTTGIRAQFWLDREHDYRTGLSVGKLDITCDTPYPDGAGHLDQVITWGACPRCLIAYEAHVAWKSELGADMVVRRCPLCGRSPDGEPPRRGNSLEQHVGSAFDPAEAPRDWQPHPETAADPGE